MYDLVFFISLAFLSNPTSELTNLGFSIHAISRSLSTKCFNPRSTLPEDVQLLFLRSVASLVVYSTALVAYILLRPSEFEIWPPLGNFLVSIAVIGYTVAYFAWKDEFRHHPCMVQLRYVYQHCYDSGALGRADATFSDFLTRVLNELRTPVTQLWISQEVRENMEQLILTQNFIIKTSKHPLAFRSILQILPIEQDRTRAVCTDSNYCADQDSHEQSQFLTFAISTPSLRQAPDISIRMWVQQYEDNFRNCFDGLGVMVVFLPQVSKDTTLFQQFVEAFRGEISANERASVETEIETCLACQVVDANVFIKSCACTRAFWCESCLARMWLSHKKRTQVWQEEWLLGSQPCPICRRSFALTDIQHIHSE